MSFTKCISALGFVFLCACVPNEPGQVQDVHTGTNAAHSKTVNAGSGLLWSLTTQAVAISKSGKTEFGILTSYTSTGLGWAFLDGAWSFGTQLDYSVRDRQVVFCSTSGCTQTESGSIRLSEAQFRQFAKTGIEFKLTGKRGAIVGRMGPEAFQQVLALRANG